MKLTYFQVTPSNFGDEINATMWSDLLPPGVLDEDDRELFLGIGSIIWDVYPKTSRKVVAGSGWAGYGVTPDVHDGSWDFLWVRGPRTAARLGLPPATAIADSAVLIRRTALPPARTGIGAAFMPHHDSVRRGDWKEVCRLAGVTFLDPHAPVADLLAAIRSARVLVTEAMHGAIVADALRTPWIAVTPQHPAHRAKWLDWADSLDLDLRPERLPPSHLREAYTRATGRGAGKPRIHALLGAAPTRPLSAALRHLAARRLRQVVERVEPQLSRDDRIEAVTSRCEEALSGFVRTRRAAAS